MPIKGWITQTRIPRVGKIHLGQRVEKENAKGALVEYPKATDYFVVKADESTSEAAARAFHAVYGEVPRELDVMFPVDDPEEFFPQYLASYRRSAGRPELFCKGDGVTASRLTDTGRVDIPCPYTECELYQAHKCSELGRLQFFLPHVAGLGVWQIDTGSYHSSSRIIGSISMIQALTGGRVRMIPLKLRIIPITVSPEGRAKTVYVLDIAVDDMKLADFLERTPTMPALAPNVEPVDMEEIPEDLRVEKDLVHEQELSVTETADEETNVASYAGREVKPSRHDPDHMIAQLKLAKRDGTMVEALTDDLTIIADTKTLQKGMTVEYVVKPSSKWTNRLEIVSIVPVA